MIQYVENGDIFSSDCEILTNPVNCKGVMGKGIALEFKKRFPECFEIYRKACKEGKLVPGTLMLVKLEIQPDLFGVKRPGILLFPTKDHWRYPSKIEWIKNGLGYLKDHYQEWNIKSVAMPTLGCGLGGLDWSEVKPLIENTFKDESLDICVYVRSVEDFGEKQNQEN